MNDRAPPWTVIAGISVLCGLAIGAVVVLLWRDRRQGLGGIGGINIWNLPNGATPETISALPRALGVPTISEVTRPMTDSGYRASKNESFSLSSTTPARIVSANGPKFWRAQVRNIGPPGSIAFVASDPSVLAFPSMTAQIPAGGFTDMRIAPNGALFALGSVEGVQLTATASEEL